MEALAILHALTSSTARLARPSYPPRWQRSEWLLAHSQARNRGWFTLSVWRIGWEILRRGWPPASDSPLPPHPTAIVHPKLLALPG